MSWRVPSQPRTVGEEWARELIFGVDSASKTSPQVFRERIVAYATDVVRTLTFAAKEVEGIASSTELNSAHKGIIDVLQELVARLDGVREQLKIRDVERPFRVVLMGRTMAGKSTLFEYLTGGDGERVGVGGPRTTRVVCVGTVADIGIEIVDTPGVGAMDGQEDFDSAFGQVTDADLILWVASDEATQAQTGEALELLSDIGKPILIALNCLHDVSHETGMNDMLESPELVFEGDAVDNLVPIRRHLAMAGGQDLGAIAIHAQAALLSVSGLPTGDESRILHQNSRIDSLMGELQYQRDRTADMRRIISICDYLRVELLETARIVGETVVIARSMLTASRGSQQEFYTRARRRIEDAYEELNAAFVSAVTTRERWVEKVDVDQNDRKINDQWDQEISQLRAEIERCGSDIGQRLDAGLKEIAIDVADDWAEVDIDGFRDLGGRGMIWGNRLVKAGGRVAVGALGTWAGVAAGAKIGAIAGTALTPGLGSAIGLAVGMIAGLLVALFGVNRGIDWIGDRIFRSPSEVHERRRQKVREQLSPMLKELAEKLESAGYEVRSSWLSAIDGEFARQATASDTIEQAMAVLMHVSSKELEPLLTQVDTELAREILRHLGRDRAASAVTRATRWRGAGMAVELPEADFSELVLFPTDEMIERILPTVARAPMQNSALHVIRNLTDHDLTVHKMEPGHLFLSLGARAVVGVREAWASLAQAHTSVRVDISEMVEGDLQ
ncbi:MAG: 50S ribosome-binding GTPase [Cryobacterium sp.]|nr:50S ribosome-binding GTPase [Cryobacterium sp.]